MFINSNLFSIIQTFFYNLFILESFINIYFLSNNYFLLISFKKNKKKKQYFVVKNILVFLNKQIQMFCI